MLIPILGLILGLVLLIKGADWLVNGVSVLAKSIMFLTWPSASLLWLLELQCRNLPPQ